MRIAVHDFGGHPFSLELARELARGGHQVRYVCFADFPGPHGDTTRRDDEPRISIDPIRLGWPHPKDVAGRWLNNRRYARVAAERLARFAPDVVLSGNTPIEAQGLLLHAAQRVGAGFVFWVQDLHAVAARTLGGARAPMVGMLAGAAYRRAESDQLRASDQVVLISDDFRAELAGADLDPARVSLIENWGALSELAPVEKDNVWAREHGLADRFVLLYAGTLGLKHDPAQLTALADAFVEDPAVAVVAVCAGAGADRLERMLAAHPRRNLRRLPLQDMARFADVLGSADVGIALLDPQAGRFSVPSKVLSYLCAGRPILLSAPAENLAAVTVGKARAGLLAPAGDAAALVAAAKTLRADAALAKRFGQSGRAYAEVHFAIGPIAQRFEAVFERAIASRRDGGRAAA